MELSECPLDGTALTVEYMAGGSMLLSCESCEAMWERHGAWVGRVRDADPDKARLARLAASRTDVHAAPI
jgi:hypothetical protein